MPAPVIHRFPVDLRAGFGIQVLENGGAFLIAVDPSALSAGGTFLTLAADPSTADIPVNSQRLVWRSDLGGPQWWWNVAGTLINVLAPRSF